MNKKDLEKELIKANSQIEKLQEQNKLLEYSLEKYSEEKIKIDDDVLLPAKILLKPIRRFRNAVLKDYKYLTYEVYLYLLFRLEETIVNECLNAMGEDKDENYL